MKIACAQINCEPANPEHNLNLMETFCQKAKEQGADFILFPELADVGYAFDQLKAAASTWDGMPVERLREMAQNFGLNIASGLTEKTDAGIFNALIVLNKQGETIASYRKIHLFVHGEIDESKRFIAGQETVTFELEGLTFGLAICYDLRFPELFRQLGLSGAEVVLLPTAWPFPREEHFKALVIARAIENQTYMVSCNRVGQDHDVMFAGSSRIVAPNGHIVASAPDNEEALIVTDIDRALIKSVREAMPVWQHRRNDLY